MSDLTPEQIAEAEAAKAEAARLKSEADAAKKAEKERIAAEKKAEKERLKAEKDAAKAAEKEAKAKAKADAAAAKAQARKSVTQNGISRPMSGKTLQVWEIADSLSAQKQAPADRKEVIEQAIAAGIESGTANTQFGRWRKFHGLAAERSAKPATPAVPPTAPVETPAGTVELPVQTGEGDEQQAAE